MGVEEFQNLPIYGLRRIGRLLMDSVTNESKKPCVRFSKLLANLGMLESVSRKYGIFHHS